MSDPLLLVVGCLVVGACVLALAFLSLSEAALLGISDIRLRALRRSGDARSRLLQELLQDNDFLTVIIVGVNACIIIISTTVTVLVSRATGVQGNWREEAIHLGMLFFMLVVAEIAPKTYGAMYAERVALRVARPISILARVTGPILSGLIVVVNGLLRLAGVKVGREFRFVTRDEIRVAADVSEEEGALEPEEGEMLDNVLELSVARVSEVMVPRVDIVALEENDPLDRVLQVVIESGYSRIPIYQATLDSITGILYVNDLLSVLSSGASEVDLKAIARAPVYVPESKLLDELLAEMRDRAVHLAIVVDEFGGTEGLVSIEDILEELVGEIEDEHDAVTEDIVLFGPDEAVVGAKERIEEVNEQLVVNLPNDQYDTVGGLITGLANRIPQIGEVYEINGVALTVEEGDDRNIERVRITVAHRDGGES